MLRDADPGAVLPGIDTPVGNPLPVSSLISYTTLPTTVSASSPFQYIPSQNRVIINKDNAVISGINFGSAEVDIDANNVTINDCTFTDPSVWWAVDQGSTFTGAIVENSSFSAGTVSSQMSSFISSNNYITIKDNSFIDTPSDTIHVTEGDITGNYISGGAYALGAHADAIYVGNSRGATTITDNFIDWTYTPGVPTPTNNAIRIADELGDVSDVTVSGNYLLGGGYTVFSNQSAYPYTMGAGIAITDNYIGFGQYGPYYPGSQNYATISGNTVFDFTNTAPSAAATAAYEASGVPTAKVIVSTTATTSLSSSASTPTTLIGNSLATHIYGSGTGETVIVGGGGAQYIFNGEGANIDTYLVASDGGDQISTFDPAKDVIDFSSMDADLATPGMQQTFTFIGDAAFSGTGAQVRYQQNPANDTTIVQLKLGGDTLSDFQISLHGLVTLTASNFALTTAQMATDLANGAALKETRVATETGGPTEVAYSNVQNQSYSSYNSFYSSNTDLAADDLFLTAPTQTTAPVLTTTSSGTSSTSTPTKPAVAAGTTLASSVQVLSTPALAQLFSSMSTIAPGLVASLAASSPTLASILKSAQAYSSTSSSSSSGSSGSSGSSSSGSTSLAANTLVLYDQGMTVDRGGGVEALVIKSVGTPLTYRPAETIDASNGGSESLSFGASFGQETVLGFMASGTTADSVQLPTASFSYLTPGMSQAQDLAAVLAHATSSASGLTIADTTGDTLTLAGITASTLTANPSAIHFA